VIGPQRAVELFRTGSTGSPDIPSPDAAMGDQVRAWARTLRGVGPAGVGVPTAPESPAPANDATGGTRGYP
jgi:hypothetical protein